MRKDSIISQLEIERELISHIGASLGKTLDWPNDADPSRKLSTMRFITEAFHRHLERLMAIHEYDGYMSYVTRMRTELTAAVDQLRRAHEALRESLRRASLRLQRLSADDGAAIESASDSLRKLLADYDRHLVAETRLIQEALLRDLGGSG